MAKTSAELVSEAKQRVENLAPDQVASELAGGNAILVDVREQNERDEKRDDRRGGARAARNARVFRRPVESLPPRRVRPESAHHRSLCLGWAIGVVGRRCSSSWATPASPTSTAVSWHGRPLGSRSKADGRRGYSPRTDSGTGVWPFTNPVMAAGSESRATACGQKTEIASPVNMCAGPSGIPPMSATLAATSAVF